MEYKIVKAVFVKLHDTHIPYIGYMIVEGPKGGKYLLDEFNIEQLFGMITHGISRLERTKRLVKYLSFIKKEFVKYNICDDTIKEEAKRLDCILIQRRNGMKSTLKIAKQLDKKQVIEINSIINSLTKP